MRQLIENTNQSRADKDRPKYPLKISTSRRYLVDQNNVPFLLQGDAPWSLIVGISREDAELYLENRRRKKFNSLLVNLIEHKYCKNPPKNFYDEEPFATPGDFSTPNEKYFEHADWIISKAAEFGIQILLCPNFLGVPGSDAGWYDEIISSSLSNCLSYGRYLGKRYADFDNIVWSIGADRDPDKDGLERINALALGIKEYDHRHLMTAQCYPESSSVDIYSSGGWLDVNATYSYTIVHRKVLADYKHSPTMPTFLIETSYEGEHNSSHEQIRRQAYWSVLCGGFGHVFGNYAIWPIGAGFTNHQAWPRTSENWQMEMDQPGSVGMFHWGNLFRSRQWYDLVPDQNNQIVTHGLGETRGLDFLGAARTADGSTIIAYMPTARSIIVDLTKLSGNKVTTWWFDPRTGVSTSAGEFSTLGAREFTPPTAGDWVLLVDDASKQLAPPGKE